MAMDPRSGFCDALSLAEGRLLLVLQALQGVIGTLVLLVPL